MDKDLRKQKLIRRYKHYSLFLSFFDKFKDFDKNSLIEKKILELKSIRNFYFFIGMILLFLSLCYFHKGDNRKTLYYLCMSYTSYIITSLNQMKKYILEQILDSNATG